MQEVGITKLQNALRRIAVVALGWILILGGVAGLFVPIIPGAFLIVVGARWSIPNVRGCGACSRNVECGFPS